MSSFVTQGSRKTVVIAGLSLLAILLHLGLRYGVGYPQKTYDVPLLVVLIAVVFTEPGFIGTALAKTGVRKQ